MIITLVKKFTYFTIILLLATLCFYSYKFSIVNQVFVPLMNQVSVLLNNQEVSFSKYSIKAQSIWDLDTSVKQFRPIPQNLVKAGIISNQNAQSMKLYPKNVEHSINSSSLEIYKGKQIISITQILSPRSVQQILQIPSIGQPKMGRFYQIKQPLFHSIFKGTFKCITLQTPSENTYANNNKFNRYVQLNQNQVVIISLAMNRVLIVQLYQCQTQNNKVISKKNYLTYKNQDQNQDSFKFQGFQIFKNIQENSFNVQLITYSKDIVTLTVLIQGKQKDYQIMFTNKQIFKSHQINHKRIYQNFQIQNQESSTQMFKKNILNVLSFAFLELKKVYEGKKQWFKIFEIKQKNNPKQNNKIQSQIPIVAINNKQNSLISLSPFSESKMWKLGKYMYATRMPVFSNEKSDQLALQKLIKNDEEQVKQLKQTNFQYFQLNNVKLDDPSDIMKLTNDQNLKIQKDQFYGIDPVIPNLQINWLGLSDRQMYFYPQNKIKDDQFYLIRSQDGGLVTQGYKLKGKYDKLPLRKDQIIQSINSRPQQLYRGIFHIHVAYKHLISYPVTEKRVELMHGLNGKAVQTYYRKVKEGFINNYMKIENNQWFLNEYHSERDISLLTKYELFANLTNIQQVLSIKRQYTFPGKISNILKSVDGYYYITSTTKQGILKFIRVGINYMNNRMAKADGKYSGVFEEMMIDKQLSKKYLQKGGLDFQQQMFIINTGIDTNYRDLQRIEKLYLYDMLPYQLFADSLKQGQDLYLFNLRNLFVGLIDRYYIQRQKDAMSVLIMTLLFLLTISLLLCFATPNRTVKKVSKQGKQETEDTQKAETQTDKLAESPKKKKNKTKQN